MINETMKKAAADALAELARRPVDEEIKKAYGGAEFTFGPNYIVPAPFDPRLIETVPPAVARAAMETGVARNPVTDWEAYGRALRNRMNRG